MSHVVFENPHSVTILYTNNFYDQANNFQKGIVILPQHSNEKIYDDDNVGD